MISGLNPKDFCSIFSETCSCVEQRGLQKKVGRRETCPCPLLWTSCSPFPSLCMSSPPWNIGNCKSESCLRKEKKLIGLQREKKWAATWRVSGWRMANQAYFTPVCSDHFVLIVHLCSRIVSALITQKPSPLLQPNAARGGNFICGTFRVLWRCPTTNCIFFLINLTYL